MTAYYTSAFLYGVCDHQPNEIEFNGNFANYIWRAKSFLFQCSFVHSVWVFYVVIFFFSVFRRSNCIFPNKQNPLEWNENIPSFIYIYAVPNWIESGRSRKMCSLITRIQSTESELRKKAEPYTFFIWFHESQLNSEIDKLLLTHPLIIASTYTYFINSIMDHEKTLKPTTKLNAIVNDTTFNY